MIRRLRCALKGHRIDYFPDDPDNVHRIAFECPCGRESVPARGVRELLDGFFDHFTAA